MGQKLVEQILINLSDMQWGGVPEPTPLGRQVFEVGVDKVDEFRKSAEPLLNGLQIFNTSDSRPYAYGGVSYTLVKASRKENGSYFQTGLDKAMEWLEDAQELAPDLVEINAIEALIYIYSSRYEDARLILDYLKGIAPNNYYLLIAEATYWQEHKKIDKTVEWYQAAINVADSVPRKLRLRGNLGDFFMNMRQFERALKVYQETIHFSKENPWIWHNMSIAHWHAHNYEEAFHCNRRALALSDLPEARRMEEALKEKLDKGGLRGWLFGR
jgi:tetratricopeptide (TPR) repeat protein